MDSPMHFLGEMGYFYRSFFLVYKPAKFRPKQPKFSGLGILANEVKISKGLSDLNSPVQDGLLVECFAFWQTKDKTPPVFKL